VSGAAAPANSQIDKENLMNVQQDTACSSHPRTRRPFATAVALVAAGACLAVAPSAQAQWVVSPCGNDAWGGLGINCFPPTPLNLRPKRTIQAAVNAAPNGATIVVLGGTYPGPIDLQGKSLHIIGAGCGQSIVDGGGSWWGFVIQGGNSIIEGLTIRNCHVNISAGGGHGGAMRIVNSSPTIRDVCFENNFADQHGGAVATVNSNATFEDCEFVGNRASLWGNLGIGGAVANFDGRPTFTRCTFRGNDCGHGEGAGGGAMANRRSSPTIVDCTFIDNGAVVNILTGARRGGAMFNDGNHGTAPVVIRRTSFTSNVAVDRGGAIYNTSSATDIRNCDFQTNEAFYLDGGAIANVDASPLHLGNCSFLRNLARSGRGGGVFNTGSAANIEGCFFSRNSSSVASGPGGGGVYSSSSGGVTRIERGVFENNTTGGIGGALFLAGATEVIGGRYQDNFAGSGGAIGCTLFTANMSIRRASAASRVWFMNNNAHQDGGAIYIADFFAFAGAGTIENCDFTGNTAGRHGGGIWGHARLISDCWFVENTAENGGGYFAKGGRRGRIENSRFLGNTATLHGGSALLVAEMMLAGPLTLINCEMYDNWTEHVPGGLGTISVGLPLGPAPVNVELINCTIAGNVGGGLFLKNSQDSTVANSILWDNDSNSITWELPSAPPTVTHSNVEGGWNGPGGNNISANPLFVDPATGDFMLSANSPCIDAGDNAVVPVGIITDLAGNPRFVSNGVPGNIATATVDMGAYEFQDGICYANCDASTTAPILNVEDFACFINEFAAAMNLSHQQQITHYANCDGSTTAPVLNVEDFACFINAFAAGCP
jgi:predicted outer membrane repeat protein